MRKEIRGSKSYQLLIGNPGWAKSHHSGKISTDSVLRMKAFFFLETEIQFFTIGDSSSVGSILIKTSSRNPSRKEGTF